MFCCVLVGKNTSSNGTEHLKRNIFKNTIKNKDSRGQLYESVVAGMPRQRIFLTLHSEARLKLSTTVTS